MSELNHLSGACLLEVHSGDCCETAIEMTSLNPGTSYLHMSLENAEIHQSQSYITNGLKPQYTLLVKVGKRYCGI